MHYSLFSRFYGCLLGLVLGEHWALQTSTATHAQARSLSHRPLHWIETLVRAGRWETALSPWPFPATEPITPGQMSAPELAIALLPIALYFHHDLRQQRHFLWQALNSAEIDADRGNQVTLWAYVLAQALRGQLQPNMAIPQMLAYLTVVAKAATAYPAPSSAICHQVQRLKPLLQQAVDLPRAATLLRQEGPDPTIAIALYMFLQTPENFQLTLTRSRALSPFSLALPALLGALSGAYNSSVGIPAQWHQLLPMAQDQRCSSETLHQVASQFLALWSGVLWVPQRSVASATTLSVSAPWSRQAD